MYSIRNVVLTAFFIAAGILLPLLFNGMGGLGRVFLPMQVPVLLAGYLLGPITGLAVGVLTPLLSTLLTGKPPLMPILPIVTVELAIYGVGAGLFYRRLHWGVWRTYLLTFALGRLATAGVVAVLATWFEVRLAPLTYLVTSIGVGLPGIALQCGLLPVLVRRLERLPLCQRQKQKCA